jgi:hypothetical protein
MDPGVYQWFRMEPEPKEGMMKRLLLLSGALLVLAAPVAWAAPGLDLNWSTGGACWSDAGGDVNLKTFACNSNTGNAAMVASFAISADMPNFVGVEVIIDGQVDAANVPDWWQLYNTGACRQTGISSSADFTGSPAVGCTDPFGNLAAGGIGAWQTETYPPPLPLNVPAANRVRLKVAYTLVDPNPLTAGVEYYAVKATVTYAKTVGTGACVGCDVPMTIVLNGIKAAPLPGTFEWVTNELHNRCIKWQNSTVDCALVPARSRTWGQVKSLYR